MKERNVKKVHADMVYYLRSKIVIPVLFSLIFVFSEVTALAQQFFTPFASAEVTGSLDKGPINMQPGAHLPQFLPEMQDTTKPVKNFNNPLLNINPESLYLKADEGSKTTLSIVSKSKWTLSCSEKWFSTSLSTGGSSAQVIITAQENTGMYARTGKITVFVEGSPLRIIEVIQKARHEE